jgi:hypothetical protein
MAKLPYFCKQEKESILFSAKGKEMVAYIPEKYFDRNIAEQEGDYINIMGIFNYTVQDIETGKNDGLRMFKFPSMFATRPYEVTKVKKLKLTANSDPEDYRVFRYRDDDQIIVSTKVIKFVGNCEKMLNLFFMLGYIINTIPYQDIQDLVIDNMAINGFSYGINNQMFGFAISETCRAKDDETVPFRLSGSKDMNAYKSMSLRNVSRLISPYTALISEDFDESVLAAMLNENPKETPLEEILVGEN